MLQGIIIRGTTPIHEFELPYPQEYIKDARVSYCQSGTAIITKTLADCRLQNSALLIDLTQEDTLMLSPSKKVEIEIRVQFTDNKVARNEELIELRVVDTINKEVLE